ncbi:F-box DNA helicase 1 [Denticeps clupeoides]|uniref:F-box DNA helicase 1 n=1 Tax=Denticeps clupeoides TaxID=299321 RepID=A0AAY4DMB9_9TELE|nr:F-box DNA helicase 1 [Denticeps clupeoides]
MESSLKGKAKRRHLTTAECAGLTDSSDGSRPLSQPLSVSCDSRDPNHGLYPRTPNKRRRRASDGQQKNITAFFPITATVRVSPQKTARVETEEETRMKELEEIDHLADITEAMWDDGEFESDVTVNNLAEEPAGCSSWGFCSSSPPSHTPKKDSYLENPVNSSAYHSGCLQTVLQDRNEKYPVEPLPDSHFGLLGVADGQWPSGHIEDLPEEVLRLVFSLLPAADLFRSIGYVCRHWRAIISDVQFLPWKKLYYRYHKEEKLAVEELNSILMNNHITQQDDLCLLNMVSYMSGFKHSTRVDPEQVLRSVRKHRLFDQAYSCITQRIPSVPQIEGGPSPWSVMAMVLLLATSVWDVWELVDCVHHSGCMCAMGGISEFLWAVATLLLAMKNNDINISNRIHYNIYYVLYLMENTSTPSGDHRTEVVRMTPEQLEITNHSIQRDHVVKIVAFAGTGKTSTLVKYASHHPHLRFLYAAFNKSVQMEAQHRFPSNVECTTVHSMAFKAIGQRYKDLKKLGGNLKPFSVAWVLPKGWGGFIYAKVVTTTINTFCASADPCISTGHVPDKYTNTKGLVERPDLYKKLKFASLAQDIWEKMIDLRPTRKTAYHMTHDGYLKLWQLQRPCFDQYDVIFIDEAQDCTPVIMDIMLSQNCGKILVGDPHQQIYTFRGAVNALHTISHTHLFYLTQSFRFGPEIAYIGATILDVCKQVKKTLVGGLQEGSVCGVYTRKGKGSLAILCRSNGTVFSEAVRVAENSPQCKIHIIGGVNSFGLQKIMDIWELMQGDNRKGNIKDPFICNFAGGALGGFMGLKSYAQNTEDRELEVKLAVVERYSNRIPQLVNLIYSRAEDSPANADYILGTVHKSKGLEFDTVILTDDFVKVSCQRHIMQKRGIKPAGGIRDDEWNLLYVGVTRAKRNLIITKSIRNILTLAGEYFLRSELTSALLEKAYPLCCSVRDCPNLLGPECALSMRKLSVTYTDGCDEGGLLCALCVEQRVGPMAFLLDSPECVRNMHVTEERVELPVNIAMLLALL